MSTTYDCTRQDTREAGLTAAANVVRSGRLVVFPTDTVYGIGCDAFDSHAVQSLLSAKGRGAGMPASVLVGSWNTLHGLVISVPPQAGDLVEAFWPGGMSIVLPHAASLAWDLGDTRGTVMLRMPLHPVALELLREVGPMAQSSANTSGQPPATDVEQAEHQLGDAVTVYLDGGPSGVATPSTIMDLTGEYPVMLREGAVSAAEVSEVLGMEIVSPAAAKAQAEAEAAAEAEAEAERAERGVATPELTAEPEPVPEPEPVAEPDTAVEPEPVAGPDPVAGPEPVSPPEDTEPATGPDQTSAEVRRRRPPRPPRGNAPRPSPYPRGN